MNFFNLKNQFFLSLFFSCFTIVAFSQKMTVVKGSVIDAETKEALIFVNVAFVGTNIGTDTDFDGNFELESKFASDSIQVSYVGYQTQTIAIEKGSRQTLNVVLAPASMNLSTVVVEAKKGGYKRKNNPAVELIKNVIAHKNENRIEAQNFYEYDKYEKIEFDLNNFDPEKMRKRRAFKKFQFLLTMWTHLS